MVWRELIDALREAGHNVTEAQVRWLITSGKISRPALDGSLRFRFTKQHLNEAKLALRSGRRKRGLTAKLCYERVQQLAKEAQGG